MTNAVARARMIRITVAGAHTADPNELQIVAYGTYADGGMIETRMDVMEPSSVFIIDCLGALRIEAAMHSFRWVAPDAEFEFVIYDDARGVLGAGRATKLDRAFASVLIHGSLPPSA